MSIRTWRWGGARGGRRLCGGLVSLHKLTRQLETERNLVSFGVSG